jgi:hypothetical protein
MLALLSTLFIPAAAWFRYSTSAICRARTHQEAGAIQKLNAASYLAWEHCASVTNMHVRSGICKYTWPGSLADRGCTAVDVAECMQTRLWKTSLMSS